MISAVFPVALLVVYLWHLTAKAWNALMHAMNGNMASKAESTGLMETDDAPTMTTNDFAPLNTALPEAEEPLAIPGLHPMDTQSANAGQAELSEVPGESSTSSEPDDRERAFWKLLLIIASSYGILDVARQSLLCLAQRAERPGRTDQHCCSAAQPSNSRSE